LGLSRAPLLRDLPKPRSRIVSVRLPGSVSERLDSYARTMARSRGRSELIVPAIEDYLSWRVPQQAELRAGLAAAERGELIDYEQVTAWIEQVRIELRRGIKKAKPSVRVERKKPASGLRKHAR